MKIPAYFLPGINIFKIRNLLQFQLHPVGKSLEFLLDNLIISCHAGDLVAQIGL